MLTTIMLLKRSTLEHSEFSDAIIESDNKRHDIDINESISMSVYELLGVDMPTGGVYKTTIQVKILSSAITDPLIVVFDSPPPPADFIAMYTRTYTPKCRVHPCDCLMNHSYRTYGI